MKFLNKNSSANDEQLITVDAPDNRRLSGIRRFCMSPLFMWLNFSCAAILLLLGQSVAAAVFFLLLISALLVICDDILATTLPFLLLCISVLPCYDSFNTFIKFVWLAPIPVGALIFHFVRYRRHITVGDNLWGHIGVSVAVILGGIGAISAEDYFSGGSLYYVLMLGAGLLVAYLLMKSQIRSRPDYDIREKLIDILLIAGVFACFEVFCLMARATIATEMTLTQFIDAYFYPISHLSSLQPTLNELFSRIMQPSNNLSTFLMIFMPVTFYRAVKRSPLYLLLSILFFACLYLTKSRSGLLLGGAEFVLCIIVFSLLVKSRALKYTFFGLGVLILILGGVFGLCYFIKNGFISKEEARFDLILRSIDNFLSNPIFGQGIGSRVNADLYPGKTGTMIWYHMMIPQVVGSMGAVGILGYGLQLFVRARLAIKKLNPYTVTFFMCYVGLLMMSQLNPGEFCPLPYGLIAVLLFIMIENEPDRKVKKLTDSEN